MSSNDDTSDTDVIEPDEITFQDVHEGLVGPVLGPVVVPDESVHTDEVTPQAFESEAAVRKWAHESAQDVEEVRSGEAHPFVTIQPVKTGWIATVYLLEGIERLDDEMR
ncbi:hypothetical protein [Halorhabdus rudnickae]|uniref:hypothetical protein n=1 Tax=Halorhabdus rudnickae TaxID=1775544 RepID=UPI0010827620|nr:hypothetical protein [Halorhabdus rudnickae]